MRLTIYYREKGRLKAISQDTDRDIPEAKWPYWFEKLARGRKIAGTMVLRYTGRTFAGF